jgi:hypothetical protein
MVPRGLRRYDVPYNFGNLYGIEQFGGAGSSLPLRIHRLLGNAETPRLFGIRYRVARQPSTRRSKRCSVRAAA